MEKKNNCVFLSSFSHCVLTILSISDVLCLLFASQLLYCQELAFSECVFCFDFFLASPSFGFPGFGVIQNQISFMYRTSVTIKIVFRCFLEFQGLTSNKEEKEGVQKKRTKQLNSQPPSVRGQGRLMSNRLLEQGIQRAGQRTWY